MTARTQQNRTTTNNAPPGALLPGQIYAEMGTPFRVWVGVPTSIDASGRKLLSDSTVPGPYLPVAGGTMQGPVALAGNTTAITPVPGDNDTSVATTAFVNTHVTNALGGLGFAPNGIGRNLIHNPLFGVAQRGTGAFTTGGYTLDRWTVAVGAPSTVSVSQLGMSDTDRAQIGDESARWQLSAICNGTTGAGHSVLLSQFIEDLRRLANKTVTLSFWAVASAGTPKLGLDIYQDFGSGGSPSAQVKLPAQSVTLATTWARYTTTWNIPSSAGKTFGTTPNSHFTGLQLWMSNGDGNPDAGGVGVQNYTLGLWGVQLEIGSVATPLEKPDPRYDLSNCQRFYCTGWAQNAGYGGVANGITVMIFHLPVTMRVATPVMATLQTAASVNVNSPALTPMDGASCQLYVQPTAVGMFNYRVQYSASADL